mgnify:CR=1 FL=1
MRVLDAAATARALPWALLMEEVALVCRENRDGRLTCPPRHSLALQQDGVLLVMPCLSERLAITKLDVLDTFETVRICVDYKVGGRRIHDYPDRLDLLAEVEPIYVDLPGWCTSLEAVRRLEDLPMRARAFVDLVEEQVGVPVRYVGVGPDRDAVVQRS